MKIDQIRFEVVPTPKPWVNKHGSEAKVLINERPFTAILRESPTFRAHPKEIWELDEAIGILPQQAFPPSTYLLGEGIHGQDLAILRCGGCGERGCWSITVQIEVEEQYILWHDLRIAYSENKRLLNEDGSRLAFKFDRQQYLAALERFRWELEPGIRVEGPIHFDPRLGWALYVYNHFEYFASQIIKVLLEGQETEARILDEWRWLCADSFLKFPKLELPKALHRFQRILFFPDTPNLLQHWLGQWLELEWLNERERHFAAARHLFPGEDLVLAPGMPVFVEVLEPGQVYALCPEKETYARIVSPP